ncbi:MAG: glucoamylase family protein [Burkholderiaceae bacterium]
MISISRSAGRLLARSMVWADRTPVREELFGIERLEQHARSLAEAQAVTVKPPKVASLHARLESNATTLLEAYRASALELESGRSAVPAAEWLLDNYYLVEEQVRDARDHLPAGFYRQLPKLAAGPFAGYPRVFGIAWAFVAHTDSHVDPEILRRFLVAYQTVQPLTIGELWAVAITLRIVLIENLRRLADQITIARGEREDAEAFADRMLASGGSRAALDDDDLVRSTDKLSEIFAAQLAKRLRNQDPATTPALGWLERRLAAQQASIEDVVQHAHQRQAVSNVSVRNIITSMRRMSDIAWSDLFERVSLVDARLREGSAFAAMDFPTRNGYRSAIEQLARGSLHSEFDIATSVLEAAATARSGTIDPVEAQRFGDPGYHLIGNGRPALERVLGFEAPLRLRIKRAIVGCGIAGYIALVLFITAGMLAGSLWLLDAPTVGTVALAAFALLVFLPFTDAATALVSRSLAQRVEAVPLPGLDLLVGVPASLRTLVAIPTLLTSRDELEEQIERLEVHYLSGGEGEVYFALLTDWADADAELVDGDQALLASAIAAMDQLNLRHLAGEAGPRFLLLHRRRVFSSGEACWMSWERKRGKLQELNALLRGATTTTFMALDGIAPRVPDAVRYVITLDADTRLPRDAALRLIGKMAHPLNAPRFDRVLQRVVDGYAILQPRVTPSLPTGRGGSFYQRVFAGPSGIDPYASASSDVYQDLVGEGSFTGKGIYDVDAFEASLAGRVPENALLSHDLFEGSFARAGLASDVEVIDEFPSRYDVDAKRQHRWVRGDWQLIPWVFGHFSGPLAVPSIGRWKMIDNLRRSLVAPATLAAFGLCAVLPLRAAAIGVVLLLAAFALPIFLSTAFTLLYRPSRVSLRNHFSTVGCDLRLAGLQMGLSFAFLADRAWRAVDAIGRTLVRVLVTRRHLLEWTTAAESARTRQLDASGFYRAMAGGTAMVAVATLALLVASPSWQVLLPLALLWLAGPLIAMHASRPLRVTRERPLNTDEERQLRSIARRTWRFFETFVTAADHMLPPDNFQEDPKPVVARRTSPTNIGLYLLSAVAARDFGWSGTVATIERIEATLATLRRLTTFNGHFYNWYATEDLRPLDPPYVSSVDSGNLAGHLIVLANACESWRGTPVAPRAWSGLRDTLREAIVVAESPSVLAKLESIVAQSQSFDDLIVAIDGLVEAPAAIPLVNSDAASWVAALRRIADEHRDDRDLPDDLRTLLDVRLTEIAREARAVALAMDFAFLLDPERKLLSIGYSLADNRLDPSCYDLLASEARLASLFAIAKGDVSTKHWFHLGRTSTPLAGGSALVSWSGSMFEYLMPSLVMRAPFGSLLDQTNRLVVGRQQGYGASLDIPWGVSESAYNARDIDFTYQYSNFGVPGLGLKRGLSDNVVIAPYATGLATMVDARGALANYGALAAIGGNGRYGYYDALDFTRARLPEGENVAIVRNYMAHHQGMTIIAIANALDDGRMRARFHTEPMIVASELLLQERMPRDVPEIDPRVEEVKLSGEWVAAEGPTLRRIAAAAGGPPVTHLLSNGRYTVMLTAAGSGYSRWGDIAITRWREDATRDAEGAYVYLRDTQSDAVWSPTLHPLTKPIVDGEAVFGEDSATFTRRDGRLLTTMEVVVSGEDDAEVRRVSLTNSGRRAREIELTSYAEVVLTTPSTDNAHPAFAKMFVQTEYLATFDALIATRRRRTPSEPEIWAAHFCVVEGERTTLPQYETDRARFVGRGRHAGTAVAIGDGRALTNTVGTVLDPVFSLRCRVKVPPGKVVRVAYWTAVAGSRAELLDLIDRHNDRNAYDRARTFAWTQTQVQLRHLGIQSEEAAEFQRLAAPILYADARFRVSSEAIRHGLGPQSGLWIHSISGDLPIVVLRIDDIDDIAQVRQLLRAHEYWRAKRLGVDLVIINERASSYVQDLQIAIETAQRSSQTRPGPDRLTTQPAHGSVYTLRADLMSAASRELLIAVARVVLTARRGPLSQQLGQMPKSSTLPPVTRPLKETPVAPASTSLRTGLEFFNGIGGFGRDGREYVVVIDGTRTTPAPWINVIANAGFGFQVSAEGAGFTWALNSRDNQLTPWSNDPVGDPVGEAIYVRDEASGDVWTPTAQPIRDGGTYVARHGFGYSRFEHEANDIGLVLLQFVPLDDPIKISRLTVRNRSTKTRVLSITAYSEWVLGTSRNASASSITTEIDGVSGALCVRNPWGTSFPGRVSFVDMQGHQSAWTGDRTEFLGRNGHTSAPAALMGRAPLSNTTGAGFDPCTALQRTIELAAGEEFEVVVCMGQCGSDADARALVARYRDIDLDTVLQDVTNYWDRLLCSVQVRTPDRAMDIMLNGWLLYQTLACRVLARSAFYQASGAYGFRDQLQDGMALTFAMPERTRQHLLRAAGRQFVEGDVQHWWLPHSGQGVRTNISDDRVWLAYAVATYIVSTGDTAVLDEPVAWLEGPVLKPGEHDAFFQPGQSDETSTLFEHCARGLDQCLALTGEHGLPLMGTGDWNDGMNRVGQEGHGESVWLGWLLIRTIDLFAVYAQGRDDARHARWRDHAVSVHAAIERDAWDGGWYRRATFDDGTWLGSKDSDECRIDSIAQSWAVLSGAADPIRAAAAMKAVDEHLVRRGDALALLFTPPFDRTRHDPGYIKGYPPGLRENGGQYSHAAMWAVLAFARLAATDKAVALFALLNPINHALNRSAVDVYKVEPYAVAADVYSIAPHVGRGGWTWYTGSAAWMHRAGIEGILGISREGDVLVFRPAMPASWPGFEATIRLGTTCYRIVVRRDAMAGSGGTRDGQPIEAANGTYRLALDSAAHEVVLTV